ncbi:MAG: 6-phosphofructokinase II [Sediminibacterium sp.]
MKKIITLTLNPALDKSISVPRLVPEKKLRCTDAKVEPGGGGVNVSRALHHLGGVSTAAFLSGGYTGKQFEALLTREGIDTVALPMAGDTRENFVVFDEATRCQYRFGMEGAHVTEQEWKHCLQYVQEQSSIDYIVASGSLPPGVPTDFMRSLVLLGRQKGARLIVDTSGEALQAALQEGLFLIKPNLGELSSVYGKEKLAPHEIAAAARSIIEQGKCEVVVVSLGAAGALLVRGTEQIQVKPPAVNVLSTVGAGDSMVAGMVYALSEGLGWKETLCYGVAAGTAATMNSGTALCSKAATERIFRSLV